MTVTSTLDVGIDAAIAPMPRPPYRTLEVEVVAGGDPVRFARIVSALVNNTPMALASVQVGDQSAYPVPARVTPGRGPMVLTLRPRNAAEVLDRLLMEQIVAIVATTARVVDARRIP